MVIYLNGRVTITSKDSDWVESIRDIICKDKPLYKSRNCKALSFTDKTMTDWLISNGCIPKKSLTVKLPTIPDLYFKDFVRGVIDGDGSISFKLAPGKRKNNIVIASRCYISSSSIDFVNNLSDKLNLLGFKNKISINKNYEHKIENRVINQTSTNYRICFSSTNTLKLLDWCYYTGNRISLNRKQIIANNLINHYKINTNYVCSTI